MPITVSPTGPLARPFPHLAELVASSATAQTALGAASAADALELIAYPFLEIEEDFSPPIILIGDMDELNQDMGRLTDQSGELYLQFFFSLNEALDDPRDQIIDFRNQLGAILTEMLANARNPNGAGGTFFGMTRWRKHQTPCLIRRKALRTGFDWLHAAFVIEWN